jgi:sugar phosphate permease
LDVLSPQHRRWRVNVFAATWLSYAGFYFCRKSFGIVKGPLKEILEVNDFELAHIWTAYLVAYMLGQFLGGWLGTKVACRRLLLGGMGISLVCNLFFGASTLMGPAGYWPLMAFMVINGFAQATGWPGNIGTLAHWFRRDERGTVIGIWGTCYQLGSVGAKAFAAMMFAWLGVAWSFWGAAAVLFAVWIAFYFLHRDKPEDLGLEAIVVEEVFVAEDGTSGAPDAWSGSVIRSIMVMGAAYFSFKFVRYALDSWSALVLKEHFQMSVEAAGYLSTVFDMVGFLGVLFAGVVSDRFFGGRRATVTFLMTLGMVVAAIVMREVGLGSVTAFSVSLALIGFTLFGPDSLLSGVGAIDVGSKKKAVLAAGIVNGIGSLGPILQEEAIGYLKVHHGIDAVFGLLIGVSALGACGTGVLWWWGRKGTSKF